MPDKMADNHNHKTSNPFEGWDSFRKAQTTQRDDMQIDNTRDVKRPRLACHLPSPSTATFDINQLYGVTFRLTTATDRFLIFRSDRRGAMAKAIFQDGLIDVLEVKPELRGHDLGGLLVSSVLVSTQPPITLEAEEEESRYGKLVRFYQQLGFQVKVNAKIQLVCHQNQVYRKVPMEYLGCPKYEVEQLTLDCFVPIHFVENNSSQDETPDRKWLLIADTTGVHFRTTRGTTFTFDENGEYLEEETSHSFQLVFDRRGFLFRSNTFGSYLSLRKQILSLQPCPVYWKTCQNFGLTCVPDQKTLYMEQSVAIQSKTYVQSQLEFYGRFARRKTLYETLQIAKELPGYPLEATLPALTLQERCFATAEALRSAGHPDWVQLIGLLFHMGGTVPVAPDEFQWQYSVPSHMLSDNISTWTGPTYMYHMIRHNQMNLPEDGIRLMHLASLSSWSKMNDTSHVEEIRDFVTECAEILWETKMPRLCDCESLWITHYARIAIKYSADGVLGW